MAKKLIDKCNQYIKKGKIDKLYKYVIENNLKEELLTQIYYDTFNGCRPEQYEEKGQLSNLALKLCMDDLTKKYGEKLTDRFAEMMYDMPNPSQRNFNLFRLMKTKINIESEREVSQIEKILDITSNKNYVTGTHITGSEIGDALASNGIRLTGHKLVARDYSDNGNVRGTLEKNVNFFDNNPIDVFMQLINSRGYNNHGHEFNDMMIVQIPKKELEQNQEGIIIEKEDDRWLNPSYIRGFARVGVKDGNIAEFSENPQFKPEFLEKKSNKEEVEKESNQQEVEKWNTEDWKDKFEQWYETSRQTKMQKLKSNVMNFMKGLLHREKQEEVGEEERE